MKYPVDDVYVGISGGECEGQNGVVKKWVKGSHYQTVNIGSTTEYDATPHLTQEPQAVKQISVDFLTVHGHAAVIDGKDYDLGISESLEFPTKNVTVKVLEGPLKGWGVVEEWVKGSPYQLVYNAGMKENIGIGSLKVGDMEAVDYDAEVVFEDLKEDKRKPEDMTMCKHWREVDDGNVSVEWCRADNCTCHCSGVFGQCDNGKFEEYKPNEI